MPQGQGFFWLSLLSPEDSAPGLSDRSSGREQSPTTQPQARRALEEPRAHLFIQVCRQVPWWRVWEGVR